LACAGCVARSAGAHASKKAFAVENACGVNVGVMVKLEVDLGRSRRSLADDYSMYLPVGALMIITSPQTTTRVLTHSWTSGCGVGSVIRIITLPTPHPMSSEFELLEAGIVRLEQSQRSAADARGRDATHVSTGGYPASSVVGTERRLDTVRSTPDCGARPVATGGGAALPQLARLESIGMVSRLA
jgi:hypothetical protein